MPRFYFDFRQDGVLAIDEQGCEFASAEDAYLDAFRAAREMWAELLDKRQDPRRCYFEIRDANANALFVLPFAEVLETCEGGAMRAPIAETMHQSITTMAYVRRAREELEHEMLNSRKVLKEGAALIKTRL